MFGLAKSLAINHDGTVVLLKIVVVHRDSVNLTRTSGNAYVNK